MGTRHDSRSPRQTRIALVLGVLVTLFLGGPAAAVAQELPTTLFLTWEGDPRTSTTAVWLERAPKEELEEKRPVRVDVRERKATEWRRVSGSRSPFGKTAFRVCHVRIDGLRPGTIYELNAGAQGAIRFRTAPPAGAPIQFVSGGDAGPYPATELTNQHAAKTDPLFALIGGDIAYADGKHADRWVEFLNIWYRTMVTPYGLSIPMVVCIGNHEVADDENLTRESAPLFYSIFRLFSENGYATIDLSEALSIVLLDSAHTTPIKGAQTEWLKSALEARQDVPHLFVAYHVPAFPSHRPLDFGIAPELRKRWVPLFEKYGVDVVFEHNEHTYKRSQVRGGAPAGDGILYLGDGAWGVHPRNVRNPAEHWHLDATSSENHFIFTRIDGSTRTHRVVNNQGELIDSVPNPMVTLSIATEARSILGLDCYVNAQPIELALTTTAGDGFHRKVRSIAGELRALAPGIRVSLGRFDNTQASAIDVGRRLLPGVYSLQAIGSIRFDDGRPGEPFSIPSLGLLRVVSENPRAPTVGVEFTPGVEFETAEGRLYTLSDFAELKLTKEGRLDKISLKKARTRKKHFAVRFSGFLQVETSGYYRFWTRSDDGSRLFIGERLIVNNDGRHEPLEETGLIHLAAGHHPYRLEYYQHGGERELEFEYAGPGFERTRVPAEALFVTDSDPAEK